MNIRHQFLLCVLALFIVGLAHTCAYAQDWQKITSSLEVKKIFLPQLTSTSLTMARTNLSQGEIKVIRALEFGKERTSAKELCLLLKADLCINGSFFDEHGKPLGLLISSGLQLHKLHQTGSVLTALFGVSKEAPFIIPRESIPNKNALETLQAGPRLISSSKLLSSSGTVDAKLSGVCITIEKDILFFTVRSSVTSVSETSLGQTLLAEKCTEAMYFDGGGSSQMFIRNSLTSEDDYDITGKDLVPVFVVVTQKH